jgi:hypothetical protein
VLILKPIFYFSVLLEFCTYFNQAFTGRDYKEPFDPTAGGMKDFTKKSHDAGKSRKSYESLAKKNNFLLRKVNYQ